MIYSVVKDENDNYYVIIIKSGERISPFFPTEHQAWTWLDDQGECL